MRELVKSVRDSTLESAGGTAALDLVLRAVRGPFMSSRTRFLVDFDLLRLRARSRAKIAKPSGDQRLLHLGCGSRRVDGWLNVDVIDSDFDIDLGRMPLPFGDDSFDSVVSQQVIEHLELDDELLPLMRELKRVVSDGGTIWLSCPDMAKVCQGYVDDRGAGLLADKRLRGAHDPSSGGRPAQLVVNWLFHQGGEHKNLFDLEILQWIAQSVGFDKCLESTEAELLSTFPEFPVRDDSFQSVYVRILV